jgi:sporulation protein YlmC with PRC-barrel domain
MAQILPSLKVTISTNDVIKPLLYEETNFTVSNASENTIVLKNSDGFVDVPKSFVDSVQKIVIIAPEDDLSNTTPLTTLRLIIDNGDDDEYNIDLPVQKFFMYEPTNDFGSYIKNIRISNSSLDDVTVILRIYGSAV